MFCRVKSLCKARNCFEIGFWIKKIVNEEPIRYSSNAEVAEEKDKKFVLKEGQKYIYIILKNINLPWS